MGTTPAAQLARLKVAYGDRHRIYHRPNGQLVAYRRDLIESIQEPIIATTVAELEQALIRARARP